MANEWLRLWHDMPNDPKWRTIARVSSQPVTVVLSVYVHLLVDASRNVTRGHVYVTPEDLASALDVTEEDINSILSAMEGRVIVDGYLSGWEKRQPKREDAGGDKAGVKSSAQRKKEQRERDAESRNVTKSHEESRNVTTDTEEDKDTDTDKTLNTHTGNSSESGVCVSAGSCCNVLMQAGISGCNPSHPILLALIDAGANEAEFANAAQSALLKNKTSFAYVIGTVKKQREDAAGLILHKGAMPTFGKPEKFDPVAFVNCGNQQGDGHGRVIDIN